MLPPSRRFPRIHRSFRRPAFSTWTSERGHACHRAVDTAVLPRAVHPTPRLRCGPASHGLGLKPWYPASTLLTSIPSFRRQCLKRIPHFATCAVPRQHLPSTDWSLSATIDPDVPVSAHHRGRRARSRRCPHLHHSPLCISPLLFFSVRIHSFRGTFATHDEIGTRSHCSSKGLLQTQPMGSCCVSQGDGNVVP
jgi:hypothetical protein